MMSFGDEDIRVHVMKEEVGDVVVLGFPGRRHVPTLA